MAVARKARTARVNPSVAKNIYYLLSLIHYLLSKVHGCENGFIRPLPGLLFQAESVGASPEKSAPSVRRQKREITLAIVPVMC